VACGNGRSRIWAGHSLHNPRFRQRAKDRLLVNEHAQAPVALSFAYKDALESQLAGSNWSAPVWLINDLDHEIRGTVQHTTGCPERETVALPDFPVSVSADGKESLDVCTDVATKRPGSICSVLR